MARINRPDSLHTELAELRRRIRLLESESGRIGGAAAALGTVGIRRSGTPARPPSWALTSALIPVRPADWWSVATTVWEPVAQASCPPGPYELTVELRLTEGVGAVRVLVGGEPATDVVEAGDEPQRRTVRVPIPAAEPGADEQVERYEQDEQPELVELVVEAHGMLRIIAALR